jgi:hypothetical protein
MGANNYNNNKPKYGFNVPPVLFFSFRSICGSDSDGARYPGKDRHPDRRSQFPDGGTFFFVHIFTSWCIFSRFVSLEGAWEGGSVRSIFSAQGGR